MGKNWNRIICAFKEHDLMFDRNYRAYKTTTFKCTRCKKEFLTGVLTGFRIVPMTEETKKDIEIVEKRMDRVQEMPIELLNKMTHSELIEYLEREESGEPLFSEEDRLEMKRLYEKEDL